MTTTRAATPTPPPEPPAETFSGSGSDVIDLAQSRQYGIVKFDCPQCSGTITVETDANIDNQIVNSFVGGPYSGTRWLGFRGGTTSRLQVDANSDWTLTVGPLSLARMETGTSPISGSGDEVVFLNTPPDTATFTHDGSSNFSVLLMTDALTVPDLVINEIGPYSGTVLFRGTGGEYAALLQISADGDWTLTPQP